ncbi:MAG: Fur family transcriptional regulator [Cyanobacteriota bacterium]|nr:Fur family transcriptional regulator [Cyanobacteriota bacterium]
MSQPPPDAAKEAPEVPGLSEGSSRGLRSSLHDRGQRLTPQRERMLALFQHLGEGRHLSAEEAHQRLRGQGEQVSLATVYRTLRLLSGMGLLKELELAEGGRRFELAGGEHRHHHHLVCVRCGRIEEFENPAVLAAAEAAAIRHGFQLLEQGVLNLRALCPACAALQTSSLAPS